MGSDQRGVGSGSARPPDKRPDADVVTRPIDGRPGQPDVARPSGRNHQLLVWRGEAVQVWPLPGSGEISVGRAPDCDIRIDFATVSRHHARLTIEPGRVRIVDLDSQNGTRANGERLTGARVLVYGDILTFGEVVAVLAEGQTTSISPEDETPSPEIEEGRALALDERTIAVVGAEMEHIYVQLARLGPTDLSVLILGETGSGKELAARALRSWSPRRERPLVTINCAALPEGLAESELFGYERGAFSGAAGAKMGLLEAADGGTVLFDEIGDLPLSVQAKLLRVIENRRLTRLGSVQERPIDIRVIAATHRELDVGVKQGWFRADLYYRLGVAVVRIPPLRVRRRELPVLARRFLNEACQRLGRAPLALDGGAIEALLAHDWPGNVRELKNLIDCVAVAAMDMTVTAKLVAEHLGPAGTKAAEESPGIFGILKSGGAGALDKTAPLRPLAEASRAFERQTIAAALAETGGNKTRAARRLGVPLRTFMDKVRRYGL